MAEGDKGGCLGTAAAEQERLVVGGWVARDEARDDRLARLMVGPQPQIDPLRLPCRSVGRGRGVGDGVSDVLVAVAGRMKT